VGRVFSGAESATRTQSIVYLSVFFKVWFVVLTIMTFCTETAAKMEINYFCSFGNTTMQMASTKVH